MDLADPRAREWRRVWPPLQGVSDSFDGATVLVDVDPNGDPYFILNADTIDFSKAPPNTTFDNAQFFVECTLFGMDRGLFQTNGRLCVARASGGGSLALPVNTFTTSTDNKIGLITPAPLSVGAANNEITFYYSRSPYQGDVFGTQNAFSDDFQRVGPLSLSEANSLRLAPLGPVSTLTMANKNGFEILAATSFATTLGTGRLSGSAPIPLLDPQENPDSPPDAAGSLLDLQRRFSLNRVGFEDWATTKFPVADASFGSRPAIRTKALSEPFDGDVHPEFAGCISQLPLGSFFRDKDFVGKTMYETRSSSGIAAIPMGVLSFVPYEASTTQPSSGNSTWEGIEFVCGNSSGTSGVGTESIIRVDGTSSVNDVANFKTTRGGAAFSAGGPWSGGTISSRFPKARPNTESGSVLFCTAYLVRSRPESTVSNEVHAGNELQMVVVTQAAPAYFRDSDIVHSASGAGEGYSAVDRFRILGRPLEKRRGKVDMNTIPSEKPLFVNKIFNNPLLFGSSDLSLNSVKQETVTIASDGQTSFTISSRPLDPTTVQLFLNGLKLKYGTDYTVSGLTNQTVTYVGGIPMVMADTLEAYYLLFLEKTDDPAP